MTPHRILDDCEKVCEALECPDPHWVTLVAYQLRGKADKWWKTWKRGRATDALSVECNEFQKAFRNQFILKSVRDARIQEFEMLRHGFRTVDEYDALFVKLSEFASHIVPDE